MKNLFRVEESDEIREVQVLGLRFPIILPKLMRLAALVWILELIVLTIAIQFFNYEMTSADPGGGLLAGFLFAYLVHTIVIQNGEANT